MLCVECATPVERLYTYYSKDNIRATTCNHCGAFADKYIECDDTIVLLDLLLLRATALRHVVFNSFNGPPDFLGLYPQVRRLIILVTLFDVYLQWAQLEKNSDPQALKFTAEYSAFVLYGFFLMSCFLDTLVVHFVVRLLARRLLGWKEPAIISKAVLIGSSSKLLPILTFIWYYDMPLVAEMVNYAVGVCMVEVLAVILRCGYLYAIILTLASMASRSLVHRGLWWLMVR